MDEDVQVVDVPEQSRFEARLDGTRAGLAAYQRTPQLVVMTHTEVDPAYEGRGVGSALVRGALDQVRAEGLHVLPVCPFVREWLAAIATTPTSSTPRPRSSARD